MSIRMPAGGGRFFTDAEIRLLLPWAQAVRSSHVRNGGGSSPSLNLADEIFNDVNGITQVPVYTEDGKLVGTADSNDINQIGGGSAQDRGHKNVGSSPIAPLPDDPGETYISAKEVADRLGMPQRQVTDMLRKDRVLHGQQNGDGGWWTVPESEVVRWAEQQQQQ